VSQARWFSEGAPFTLEWQDSSGAIVSPSHGIGCVPLSSFDLVGSLGLQLRTLTVTGAILIRDVTLILNSSGPGGGSAGFALSLPNPATSTRRVLKFKNVDGQPYAITPYAAETIDGQAGPNNLTVKNDVLTLQCDGTNWWVIP